jgi:hypothetical protein
MNIFRLLCLGAVFVVSCAASAAPMLTPAQKAAICGKRSTCKLVAIHPAGKLQVAEVLFSVKDKPDDAPDEGCKTADGDDPANGGTEYWLLNGAKPTNVLSLCNDGYGAAGMGEDDVSFSSNRMVHVQNGGSSWRWDNTDTISLVPLQLLSQSSCSFHNIEPATGTVTQVDFVKFRVAEIRKNPGAKWSDADSDIGCPDVKPAAFANLKPIPGDKLLADYPVMMPGNANDTALTNIPSGTTLGACAMALSTDGANGFLTFGKPADGAHAAWMRVLAVNSKTLLLQIHDPLAAAAPPGKSWIGGAHAEIWQKGNYDDSQGAPKRSDLGQIAVDLDGTVHSAGEAKAPQVKHWTATDEKGRPVTVLLLTWADDISYAAISYSQAENGKQARLVTNVAMARGVPMVMPSVIGMQNKCAVRGGRIELAGMMPLTSN